MWLQVVSLYEILQCWQQNKAYCGHGSFKSLDSVFRKMWLMERDWHFLFYILPTKLKVHKNYSKFFSFFSFLYDQ